MKFCFQAFDRVFPFSHFNRVHCNKNSKCRLSGFSTSLSDLVKRAHELHRIPAQVLDCLPSMSDLHKLKDDFKTSLPSLSGWNVADLVTSCLPEQFSQANQTDNNAVLLVSVKSTQFDLFFNQEPVVDHINSRTSISISSNFSSISNEPFFPMPFVRLPNELSFLSILFSQHGIPLMVSPISRLAFFTFLSVAMFCLLASSICHLLYCHSERLSYIMLRIDYAGFAALISMSFYPPVYFSFICSPFFCSLYLASITLLALTTIVFSLLPFFQKPKFCRFRAFLFFGMGISGVTAIVHKLILYKNQKEALQTTLYEVLMEVSYGLGALVYATRIPERWRPGKFDITGDSHQLFHVLVVAGAYMHYRARLVYLQWRDLRGC